MQNRIVCQTEADQTEEEGTLIKAHDPQTAEDEPVEITPDNLKSTLGRMLNALRQPEPKDA